MKKTLFTACVMVLAAAAMAQKPTDGTPSSVEVQLNLTGTSTIVAPVLKYRYFISPKMAIRFGLGLNTSKVTNNYAENGDGSGGKGTEEIKTSNWSVAPGFEYHFAGTEKLSPYLGLAIQFGGGKSTTTWTNYDGASYSNGFSKTVEAPTAMFGIGILAGTDYYFAQNFFAGAEMGLMIKNETTKEGTTTITSGGTTSTSKSLESKNSSMGFAPTAGIRLGWRF